MTSSKLRANARESLKGKWGKSALITLIYFIASYVINLVAGFIPVIGSIILYAISLPIAYGFLVTFIKLKRNEEVSYVSFFELGFSNFKKIWCVTGNIILKLIIPLILIVVFIFAMLFAGIGAFIGISHDSTSSTLGFSGITLICLIGYIVSLIYLIVKGYLYSLSFFILNDNKEISAKEIVEKSEKLMKGNRWSYFWLGFTFIGWAILASLSLGIGFLWLIPYLQVTFINFYESLAALNDNNLEVENIIEK